MHKMSCRAAWVGVVMALAFAGPAGAGVLFFSTGDPDGKIATASRPATPGSSEIESADDFILSQPTIIDQASFTGLLTGGATLANISNVRVEIYRVFPNDSTNPPSGNVPTRVNSPSDVAFADRDLTTGLTFTTMTLNANFTAMNSVVNGINKSPNQTTGGQGAITGTEVQFNVNFATPSLLPADHYFFIPQVATSAGNFLWLSAPRPIMSPGTPFAPDLQSWIRNAALDPDWLRIGTDIVGAGTFNASFSLSGTALPVPEPSTWLAAMTGAITLAGLGLRRRHSG